MHRFYYDDKRTWFTVLLKIQAKPGRPRSTTPHRLLPNKIARARSETPLNVRPVPQDQPWKNNNKINVFYCCGRSTCTPSELIVMGGSKGRLGLPFPLLFKETDKALYRHLLHWHASHEPMEPIEEFKAPASTAIEADKKNTCVKGIHCTCLHFDLALTRNKVLKTTAAVLLTIVTSAL